MDNRAEIKEMIESVIQGFAESNKIRRGIIDKNSSRVIGDCGFYKIDSKNKSGEISYRLARPYWGKGIVSQVLNKMFYFGFEEINLNRVEASVIPGNKGSI